ncbi:TetR/AcrR family transcriptional regulator [Paenibacillus sp. XY044]|uniref:TetR/AcrR family transcriptional regulator n=1 Tax=Paenibacillus sp. XY044 TaxID=2026089 RepID=UPI00211AD9CC|nr:TetR/AcrR family transcriptional regulator [Paenibacillus sp. XY044]
MAAPRSSPRQRLLETASDLFYRIGIRSVGVDTISEQSGVGKPTMYRHFSTKDELISAYLEEENRRHWQWFEEVLTAYQGNAKAQLLALLEVTAQMISEPGYRGCAFLNVLAEFSDEGHPARRQAIEHKQELNRRLYDICREAGALDPKVLADQLSLVINGALASAPIFGAAGPTGQLTAIGTHLINLQFNAPNG